MKVGEAQVCRVCGKTYTLEQWLALPLPSSGREFGDWQEDDDGRRVRLQFRNCPCGGTMVMEVYDEEEA